MVSAALPAAFAVPAAYGDFVAGIIAIIATIALAKKVSWAVPAVWVFNVWGAADLLFAFYEGPHARIDPGTLGAAFYIPTAIVVPLLTAHFLIFRLLMRKEKKNATVASKSLFVQPATPEQVHRTTMLGAGNIKSRSGVLVGVAVTGSGVGRPAHAKQKCPPGNGSNRVEGFVAVGQRRSIIEALSHFRQFDTWKL